MIRNKTLNILSIAILLVIVSCNRNLKKEYYPNGNLKAEYESIDTIKTGYYKSYFENGNLKKECIYVNNKYQGLVKVFYENGKLNWEAYYDAGINNGLYNSYSENGIRISEGYFKNGEQDSITKTYFLDGKLKTEQLWQNGKKDGNFREYTDKGQIKSYALFENDSVKYWEKYNENGELIKLHREIRIEPKEDTIRVNSNFKRKIIVYGPDITNVKITVGLWPVGIFKGKPRYEEIPIKNGVANYSINIDKLGEYYFNVAVTDSRLVGYIESNTLKLISVR